MDNVLKTCIHVLKKLIKFFFLKTDNLLKLVFMLNKVNKNFLKNNFVFMFKKVNKKVNKKILKTIYLNNALQH